MTTEKMLMLMVMYRMFSLLQKMDYNYQLLLTGESCGFILHKEKKQNFANFESALEILFFELNENVMEIDYDR